MAVNIAKELSTEELAFFTRASDFRGCLAVFFDWSLIAAAMALVAYHGAWWTVLLALFVIGGRQLGLAILMHEASHRSLFRTKWLNQAVGTWLCAAPIWTRLDAYRKHHLAHHAFTGTERDPDLGLVTPFPTTRWGLIRKLGRDLIGLTGLRRIVALVLMDFGFITFTASVGAKRVDQRERSLGHVIVTGTRNLGPVVLTNGTLFGILWALGHPELMLLWVGAYLTTYSLFLRIRSMAEHAGLELTDDQWRNTRTTRAGWVARLFVAPHRVNYHLEHHLLISVPYFRLPAFRKLLESKGLLEGTPEAKGYLEMLSVASSRS